MGPGEYLLDKLAAAKCIFLDVDGVLADFVAGAFRAHGKYLEPESVTWDFYKQMGLEPAEFWSVANYDFWRNLMWTPEGPELLKLLEDIAGERIVLLTSPCDTPGSVQGKVDWVKAFMPQYKGRLMVGSAKHLVAGPGKLLVDDHGANVDKFREHGGQAVLVPRPWNELKTETVKGCFDPVAVASRVRAAWQNL